MAQVYVRNLVASRARPVQQLVGFSRIEIAPGEGKHVTLEVPTERLAFHTVDGVFRAEPGEFSVMVGGASDDVRLTGTLIVAE